MRIKAKCDYVRVVNFFKHKDEDFYIPALTIREPRMRSKREERLKRISQKQEQMHTLHERYCVGRAEIEIGILYGVGIARTPEVMFEDFMERDESFNGHTVHQIREIFPPSLARKIQSKNAHKRSYDEFSGKTRQNDYDLRKQKTVYNNTVGKRLTSAGYRS